MDKYEQGFGVWKKLARTLFFPRQAAKEVDFKSWIVTDFDNCLEGNPYTMNDEDGQQEQKDKK